MAQQTAVDWLADEIGYNLLMWPNDTDYWMSGLVEKAKQMQKEHHAETFKQSRQAKIFEEGMPPVWENFEQYYKETYGTTDGS